MNMKTMVLRVRTFILQELVVLDKEHLIDTCCVINA